jgi:hypothetical protein
MNPIGSKHSAENGHCQLPAGLQAARCKGMTAAHPAHQASPDLHQYRPLRWSTQPQCQHTCLYVSLRIHMDACSLQQPAAQPTAKIIHRPAMLLVSARNCCTTTHHAMQKPFSVCHQETHQHSHTSSTGTASLTMRGAQPQPQALCC